MKNYSIWKDNSNIKKYNKLDKDIYTDILIIGGGITGISCLYHLTNENLSVTLVEKNRVGMSTTSNSTGKITYMQNDIIDKIKKESSKIKYLKSQIDAMNLLVDTINKLNIECDLQKTSSYIYTTKQYEIEKLKNLKLFLIKNNNKINDGNINIVENKYSIKANDTYIFNPLKFIGGLLEKRHYNIYEDTCIEKIKRKNNFYYCYTDKYLIKAKYVVVASHYPYFNIPFLFPIKASLEKSYLSASKKQIENISLISYNKPSISIRNYKDYLIYLANSHIITNSLNSKKNFKKLINELKTMNLTPDYLWSNSDIITNDYMPYIGKIKENLFIATGYNTWGFTNGFLSGKIITDIISKRNNPYIKLFNPKRINKKIITGIFKNIFLNFIGFVTSYMYIENYKKHKNICRTCPHLKCRLTYNEIEETFDCHCHGSRFDKEGKNIKSPANKNIKE